MYRLLVAVFVLLAAVWAAVTVTAQAPPATPALTGRVVDLAEILSPTTEDVLAVRLATHEDSTTIQVVVLTIPSLDGAVLEEFATAVFREWGLGTAEADNGVLLLVARDDREIRIEVGYGLEGSLTDARAGRIIRNEMTPRFRNGDFDGGVLAAVEAIVAASMGESLPEAEPLVTPTVSPLTHYKPWLSSAWWAHVLFVVTAGALAVWLALRSLVREALVGRLLHAALATGALVFVYAQLDPKLSTLAEVRPSVGSAVEAVRWLLQALVVLTPIALITLDLYVARMPAFAPVRARRMAIQRASRAGKKTVEVDGRTYRVPRWNASTTFTGGGYRVGSYSRGSSRGGFSGGGGSSGGGGASGGW